MTPNMNLVEFVQKLVTLDIGNEEENSEKADEGPSDEDDPFRMFPSNDEEENAEDWTLKWPRD